MTRDEAVKMLQATRLMLMDGANQPISDLYYALVMAIEALKQTENSSEKPNNCEHITEDGVTCAKYPACDDCLDNPLNKVKGSERLLKGKTEPTSSKMEQVDKDINVRGKDEPYIDIETGILHWCGWKYRRIYEDEPQTHTVDLGNGFSITANDCDTCKHRDKPFDDLPCDMCCKAHSGYEPKDEPQTENLFTDKDGDVWEWRGDAWYCISGKTDCAWK